MPSKWTVGFLLAAVAPLAVSCAPADDDDVVCDEEGKCDEVKATPCDGIMKDKSGGTGKKVAGRNNDPLAKAVWHTGDSCPTSFSDIMDKLRKNDKEGCPNEQDGLTTRLISETAQATGTPTSYRAVTTRVCNNRDTDGIVFSLFGLQAGGSIPQGVEMIAFDESAGIFNYYETDGRTLNFFGNSKDMLKGPASGDVRRCANCHVAGGLVMKELDTPWMHWEGHINTPGAEDLVKKNAKNLGSKTSGAEFEGVVKGGNAKWNKTRIATLKASGKLEDVLKPLFCTPEFNLDNGSNFDSPVKGGAGGDQLSSVPFDALLDPQLKSFGSISVQFQDYDDLIKANGQSVPGVAGAVDTIIDFMFVERSHIDNDYVEQLKAAGIIDDDFIKDVLMVDFTRPVFSEDRCGLLSFAPKLAAGDMKADKIRDGFIASLSSETPTATSPAGLLLKNLQAKGDAAAHSTKVDAFVAACTALGSKPFLQNTLAVVSLNRKTAQERPVMEFASTIPTDNQNVAKGTRLHPTTCALTTAFVP